MSYQNPYAFQFKIDDNIEKEIAFHMRINHDDDNVILCHFTVTHFARFRG